MSTKKHLLTVMRDEVFPKVEKLPEAWSASDAQAAVGDGLFFDHYEIQNVCGTYGCLLYWVCQNEAFQEFVEHDDDGLVDWYATSERVAAALSLHADSLFGYVCDAGTLADRKQLILDALEECDD